MFLSFPHNISSIAGKEDGSCFKPEGTRHTKQREGTCRPHAVTCERAMVILTMVSNNVESY